MTNVTRSEKGIVGNVLSKSSYWYGSLSLYVQNTVVKVRSRNMTPRPSYKPLNLPRSPATSNQFFEKRMILVYFLFYPCTPV